jgi:uncharacterized membrane protein YfcA
VTLIDPVTLALVSAGIFAGAVVSCLVGFAFSAVAGAILLHVLTPAEAVPLMMACSIVTQTVSLVALRGSFKWRGNPLLIAGGIIGVPPALYLLDHIDVQLFRTGFGLFLAGYAIMMLLRPTAMLVQGKPGGVPHALVGFAGGVVGGLTAMPGALPTIWCDLRGMAKDERRALVQPYITVLQVFALTLVLMQDSVTPESLLRLTCALPALGAGAALGLIIFRKVNNGAFRGIVLTALLIGGVSLVM